MAEPNEILNIISKKVKTSPFVENTAKKYSDEQALEEFLPNDKFWGIFTSQDEIYLGTRGSGKTLLMRMASYSLLKRIDHPKAKEIIKAREFICFFVPLNLEFSTILTSEEKNQEYFLFSLNCMSIISFLETFELVIKDIEKDAINAKNLIIELTSLFERHVFNTSDCLLFTDLIEKIQLIYDQTDPWNDDEENNVPTILYKELLTPVLRFVDFLGKRIKILSNTIWVTCIDEAEFLSLEHQKCINAFMRSRRKNLIIKMTTLPEKHLTFETTNKQAFVDENDFHYRYIDYNCDEKDFEDVTDHLILTRLKKNLNENKIKKLGDIFGEKGIINDQAEYFGLALGLSNERAKEIIEKGILEALSDKRKEKLIDLGDDLKSKDDQFFDKFRPAFYLRYAKKQNSRGNRVFEWFIGTRTIRKVSDGNPRRFLELMDFIFQNAIQKDLTSKDIHRLIISFCMKEARKAMTLPNDGFSLTKLIEAIGNLLSNRIHGSIMMDSGCNFYVDSSLLRDKNIMDAIKLGIDYNHIKLVDQSERIITADTELRLSYIYAVIHWLPMRNVDTPTFCLKPKHYTLDFPLKVKSIDEAIKLIDSYQLELLNASTT